MDRNLGTTGYVMIPRALLLKAFDEHHEASGDLEAFLRILTYVNYAEAVVRRVNTNVVCARGESVISYSHWAEILGWSLGRTRHYFMRLVAEGNIEQVKGDCASHIRIPGYDVWTGKSQTGKKGDSAVEESFGQFWNEYHETTRMARQNRESALREWKKLSQNERKQALEHIDEYLFHLRDTKFCRQAAKYLADKLFLAVIQAIFRAGKQIDILTVKYELASCGNLEKVGGPYTLVRLASRVASGAHLEYHACILREMYVRREVILGSYKLLAAASDESVDIADVLAGIHDLLDHLEGEMGTADHLRTMGQLMEDTMVQVEARVEGNRNGITGIPTDFTDLDKLTAGWHRGDLDVIAATPPGSRKNGLCIASGQGSGNSGIFGSGFQSGNAGRAFGRPLAGCCR